jgi:hypothetical protein
MIGYLLDWLEWRPPRTTPSNDKSPTDHIDSLPSYTTGSVALEALILQSTDNEIRLSGASVDEYESQVATVST